MCLRAEEEGIVVNPDGITNSYDEFGNVFVSGNTETKNPYTYNAEYTDASTGNQYLRARYYLIIKKQSFWYELKDDN